MTDATRRFVLAIFLIGVVGIGAELVLLAHVEDAKQWIPLVLIAASVVVAAGAWMAPARPILRVFGALMVMFILSGLVGMALHFQANIEFQMEVDPSIRGLALVQKALRAKTPPALAPGAMIQLGLLGLVFTFRHPGFSRIQM
jgi:hypothetical protein